MDGLFSLAAAADMLGDYRGAAVGRTVGSGGDVYADSYVYGSDGGVLGTLSPMSKKRSGSAEPTTPLKRAKLGAAPASPAPPKSPAARLLAATRSPGRLILPKSPAKFGIRSPLRTIIDSAVAADSMSRQLTLSSGHDSGRGTGSAFVALSKRFSSKLLRWCTYEWFYSSLDRDFFNENEFVTCLDMLGIRKDVPLTRGEWSVVRSLMGERIGRPRRLSRAFLAGERQRLRHFRNCARSIQFGSALVSDEEIEDFSYPVYPAISVGDCVTAFHAQSGLLLRGQVLSVDLLSRADRVPVYRVQFEYPVLFSATFTDEELCIHGDVSVLTGESASSGSMDGGAALGGLNASGNGTAAVPGSEGKSSPSGQHHQQLWEQTAALKYFLERKENLVDALRVLQDEAARERSRWMKSAAGAGGVVAGSLDSQALAYTQTFVEQRDWVARNIEKTDRIIGQLVRRIDASGTGASNGSTVGAAAAGSSDSGAAEGIGVSEIWGDLEAAAEKLLGTSKPGENGGYRMAVLSVTMLLMLKRYCVEEFCRPIELCQWMVDKLGDFKSMPQVQNIIGQIETICFGSTF